LGHVDKVEFKATGKQIIEPGWRVVFDNEKSDSSANQKSESNKGEADENIMPTFEQGEHGPHQPEVQEKKTRPPKYFTEATLLRAMETAGKNVDEEELREAMKENGIGRPSTRANIIETLFRRKYIEKKKKNLHATPTGVGLIDTIHSDLLKSAELTGQWEHKLRLIEKGEYDVQQFREELKEMVVGLTNDVLSDKGKKIVLPEEKKKSTPIDLPPCPKCKEGQILKGKKAYGCSTYKDGCDFVLPFAILGKKLTEKQATDLLKKGKTTKMTGILLPGSEEKRAGKFVLTEDFNVSFEET
jgi:DNA topoisomerase-3